MKFINGFVSSLGTKQGIISVLIVIAVAILFFAIGKKKGHGLSTRDVVAIGIGAALYGALSMIAIPIGPNTSFRIAVALLVIFGALFGPVVGFLVGFIGHALNDALMYGSVWWSWVFLSAILGLSGGLVKFDRSFDALSGRISKSHYWQLYLYSLLGIVIGSVAAFAGDVLLYGEPPQKVWLQIILASVSNFIVLAVIGIPVVIALAKMRGKNTNLQISE
ncbi:energy-coupling factor transport system substrate-specific component [Hydrogenispora ethanolica]|jgi:energy-coupling factor transport system substrate-specific component|uniref:Energy-coupling factor transport system substrate-specific component n=1 Tax=Hydrogenispora ethanolica TaxID=1082276 RepID=A0A4R1R5R3_HYDET|nr:ECF-type riboflavin transporter substrate-binding protein [Hydrogenispora ethanolica]TCL60874.1 energy-coupling factor transport system substrate-specific component [Hydrogenispora ethanolica]